MKTLTSMGVAVAMVVLAHGASAAPGRSSVGGGVGLDMPLGNFSDQASLGWHLTGTGTYMIDRMWGIGGELGFAGYGPDSDLQDDLDRRVGVKVKISQSAFSFGAHGVFAFPTTARARPYVRLGLGIVNTSGTIKARGEKLFDDSSTNFGLDVGGGLVLWTTPHFGLGFDGRFRFIPGAITDATGDETSAQVLSFGLRALYGTGR